MTTTLDTTDTTGTADASHTDLLVTPQHPLDAPAMLERMLSATLGTLEVLAFHLGERLGWYRALAAEGALTSTELAHRTGTAERYAREWLEHQAAGGYLTVDDAGEAPTARRYTLPATHAEVLIDTDSLSYLGGLPRIAVAGAKQMDALLEAYRTGGGVGWDRLGADAREAQSAQNRPYFLHRLTQDLVPQVPELEAALRSATRIADVGCGEGWSTIGLALAYPDAQLEGFDLDEPSVVAGRRHVTGAGLSDRVRLHAGDAATHPAAAVAGDGTGFDVVFAGECIHDMGDPVAVLATMRRMVRPGGWVVVMDELTEERFTAPAGPWDRILYGFSLTVCLPDGMSHEDSAGTGTVMRPDVLDGYARRAGFAAAEVLPIEDESFRFYRLVG